MNRDETITLTTATGPVHFRLGTMTRAQADAFTRIPQPGEWFVVHSDEAIKSGPKGPFTLLLGSDEGTIRPITIDEKGVTL